MSVLSFILLSDIKINCCVNPSLMSFEALMTSQVGTRYCVQKPIDRRHQTTNFIGDTRSVILEEPVTCELMEIVLRRFS